MSSLHPEAPSDGPHLGSASAAVSALELRLVKLESDVLPGSSRVALINDDSAGDQGVSIGRDRLAAFDQRARLRLPALEVSKHHANIFLGPDQRGNKCYSIIDTGSTRGTFVLKWERALELLDYEIGSLDFPSATEIASISTRHYDRLAEPKRASPPRLLEHLDLLRIGHTTFQVHIHRPRDRPDEMSLVRSICCDSCSLAFTAESQSGNQNQETGEIPLFQHQRSTKSIGQSQLPKSGPIQAAQGDKSDRQQPYGQDTLRSSGDRRLDAEAERRRKMNEMRQVYFGAAKDGTVNPPKEALHVDQGRQRGNYRDRAAERRTLHPGAGQGTVAATVPAQLETTEAAERQKPAHSAAPKALDETNAGFRMLVKMGYKANTMPESSESGGGVEARGMLDGERRGLGSKPLQSIDEIAVHVGQQHKRKSTSFVEYRESGRELARRRLEQETRREASQ